MKSGTRVEAMNLSAIYEGVRAFCLANIQLIARLALSLLAIFIFLHVAFPELLQFLEPHGFAKSSLTSAVAAATGIWLVERVILLHEEIRNPSIAVFSRQSENDELRKHVQKHPARQVDLLQVSGQTVMPFVDQLVRICPRVEVRMLLINERVARALDSDGRVDHVSRVKTTVQELELRCEEVPTAKFEIKYYDSDPALCAVIIDNRYVSLSWSPTFRDPGDPRVSRVRGHRAATLRGVGTEAEPVLAFARSHFDLIWEGAQPVMRVPAAASPPAPAGGAVVNDRQGPDGRTG